MLMILESKTFLFFLVEYIFTAENTQPQRGVCRTMNPAASVYNTGGKKDVILTIFRRKARMLLLVFASRFQDSDHRRICDGALQTKIISKQGKYVYVCGCTTRVCHKARTV